MSSSIVKQALEIVDRDDLRQQRYRQKKEKKAKDVLAAKHLKDLHGSKKLTISELRKTFTPKEEIYEKNLKKLALLRKITTVQIDEEIRNQIIERSVTKRPITSKSKKKKDKQTVFTEEDFKKFEEEYTGE
ncbi:hypothetical protein HHI36_021918 [Cryptolaemus montrouzieri]|uniref:Active regulator of SIRT1 n=1 Tax=Cryptolaemus montrouzieri TaxID=559131 RepID=A0ABD2MYZ1_9CUCU